MKTIVFKQDIHNDSFLIRKEVFVDEQGFEDEFDDVDKVSTHVIIYIDDVPVATGRLYQTEIKNTYKIGRVAVRKQYRGLDIGNDVIKALEEKAKEMGCEIVTLSSQLQAKGFYEKCGFTAHDEIFYDQSCPHIEMDKRI